MKTQKISGFMVALSLVCWLAPREALAAISYNYFYIAGQSNYNSVTPGSALDVPLYLEEVNSDGSSASLLGDEHGLSAAGLSVTFTSGANPATITGVIGNSGAVPNGFDEPITTQSTSSSASILENLNITDSAGVKANSLGNGVSVVLLGILTLQASSLGGQTTVFAVSPFDPGVGNTFTNDSGYDLDDNADAGNPSGSLILYNSAAATTFSVTTSSVPEPAPLSLLILGSAILLRRKHLRLGGWPAFH